MRLSQVCKELPAKNAFIQRALSENERALLKTYAEIRPYLISLKKNEPPKDKETVEKVVALFEKAEKIPVSSGQIGNSVSSSELLPYLNLINDISKHLAPNDSRAVFLSVIDEKDRAGYDWKLVLHLLEMYQRISITPLTFHKEYLLKQIGSPQWIHRKGHSSKLLKQYISDLEKFHEKAVSLNPVYQLSRQIDQVMDFETPLSSYSYDGIRKKYLSELDRTRFWYKILYKILPREKTRIEKLNQLRLENFIHRLNMFNMIVNESRKSSGEGRWTIPTKPERFSSPSVKLNNGDRLGLLFNSKCGYQKWSEPDMLFEMALVEFQYYEVPGGRVSRDWRIYIYPCRSSEHSCVFTFFENEQLLRVAQVAFALRAWQLDHDGQLPETLEPLIGDYLKYMPTDPAGGEPFYYRKDGFKLKQYVKNQNNYKNFRNDSPVLIAFPSDAVPMKFYG